MNFLKFCFVFVALFGAVLASEKPKVICYYESWVHWRGGDGKMVPEDIGESKKLVFNF